METRDVILQSAEDLAVGLVAGNDRLSPEEVLQAILTWNVTIGEIAARFEGKIRDLIPIPVDEPGHAGQAAATARNAAMAKLVDRERENA